ncbi:monodechloroaminopyrrolnitrin synthase PrnB family protein [Nonomuraea dietziae]|uniref:monodechloroaminopyrrolnitrin synthase PrnB family protein n=1 Tax=Nonomuraea dietziae TaxID=65515 RepID=UPI0033D7CBAB
MNTGTTIPGTQGEAASAPGGRANTAIDLLDQWIRGEFVDLNTKLEEAYFSARSEVLTDRPDLDKLKQAIVREGSRLISQIADEGKPPMSQQERYELLGLVGFYLAACRRHEADLPGGVNAGALSPAWSLAGLLGASLGVAPRYVFAHQSLFNPSVRDTYRTFTALDDERVFITTNGLAVLAYQRAAAALRQIPAMGVSSPLATYLFEDARAALDDVLRFNRTLSETLDVDRFFFNIRPYFKTYRVGDAEYRGANAGDFAAINEIDLLLGVCSARDPFYQHVLAEKYAYVPPEDQSRLRSAVSGGTLLDSFLREATPGPLTPQFRHNTELFLAICRAHGAAYTFHHHKLVKPFLEAPAGTEPQGQARGITASGPPLEAVISGLARLSDLRAARDRSGLSTARASLNRLANLLAHDGGANGESEQ